MAGRIKAPTYKNEGDVKKRVKKLLDDFGWFWFMPPANAYGKSGIADIIAIKAGVFLAVETKFGTNKPTALQVGFLNSIQSQDGMAFVVSDRSIEWFEAWLGAFDRASAAVAAETQVTDEDGAMMIDAIRAMTALI